MKTVSRHSFPSISSTCRFVFFVLTVVLIHISTSQTARGATDGLTADQFKALIAPVSVYKALGDAARAQGNIGDVVTNSEGGGGDQITEEMVTTLGGAGGADAFGANLNTVKGRLNCGASHDDIMTAVGSNPMGLLVPADSGKSLDAALKEAQGKIGTVAGGATDINSGITDLLGQLNLKRVTVLNNKAPGDNSVRIIIPIAGNLDAKFNKLADLIKALATNSVWEAFTSP